MFYIYGWTPLKHEFSEGKRESMDNYEGMPLPSIEADEINIF